MCVPLRKHYQPLRKRFGATYCEIHFHRGIATGLWHTQACPLRSAPRQKILVSVHRLRIPCDSLRPSKAFPADPRLYRFAPCWWQNSVARGQGNRSHYPALMRHGLHPARCGRVELSAKIGPDATTRSARRARYSTCRSAQLFPAVNTRRVYREFRKPFLTVPLEFTSIRVLP